MRNPKGLRWMARAVLLLTGVLVAAAPGWGAIFTDIQGLPMQRAIERLAAKGIFRGTSGTTFNPGGSVTRGEFAVLMVRALGLETGAAVLPAFRDSAEIPRDQQPAVAAMVNLGSISPTAEARGKVELKKGALVYTLSTDKAVYQPGDLIEITFTVRNTGPADVQFEHVNSQLYDFIIRAADGTEVAKWSLGRPFLPMDQPVVLVAGRQFEWKTRWKQLDQSDDPVGPGRYEIIAVHTTKSAPTQLSLFFNKGVMAPYPDNTFRPKEEVSRLELATVGARAVGLGDAPAEALAATDAGTIPAAARGSVAAALDRRLVSLVGNREFRPAQRATRAEVAQALDVVMTMLNRYRFSKGILKDPVSGSPAQLTIEDDRKALRTYRVARHHAVYRNDRPAELRDLRPGDTVLFLNIGDVGDVAYIEATGR
ncbi:MAG: S-layer homology domain-containing protein [Armatimonadota bacterium]|nr:S-layer homology domain-containing protein [Armatimonadota bacterium]MDR7451120.1 S-layer homology domain-containing protein [Armatimonadota bacterium]MDR7467275.1 S-layer homology domain-containing protein [Armatimonadota bacterium]MDR7494536.1 S-layer homology domain-containing protein [Armatimonadota bacterium]MDR7499887.1 S-layer homology domain-containing protein [Armatimonadota bacterium]